MKAKRLLFSGLLLGAAVALARRASTRRAPAPTTPPGDEHAAAGRPATDEEIYAFVESQRRRVGVPGVYLTIIEGNRVVHQRGFGAARPGGEAPTALTPFYIGSVNKSFIALSVMQLVEAGKVELDAPLQRYLPWFRVADAAASAAITVRHLLNQTSGLPTSAGEGPLTDFDPCPGASQRQARALATQVLVHPVGTVFEYCNANYGLLALLVEAASGLTFANYLRQHILEPLGMHHTYTSPEEAKENGVAVGHRFWFGYPVAEPDLPLPYGLLRTTLIISCAHDLSRYLLAMLHGGQLGTVRILSSAGVEELHRAAVRVTAYGLDLGEYGMGWWVSKVGQSKLVWHGGTMPDFGAQVALLPQQNKATLLLFNACSHWMTPVFADWGNSVAALVAGAPYTPTPFFASVPPALPAQLLIPVIQAAGMLAFLSRLRRPRKERGWGRMLVLPLLASLSPALALRPVLGKSGAYWKLYMPDLYLLGTVCGSLALVWSLIGGGLFLRVLRRGPSARS